MSDLVYRVQIQYSTSGSLNTGLTGAQAQADKLNSTFSSLAGVSRDIGSSLVSSFQGAVEAAGNVALTLGKMATVGGLALATYGVVGLNKELESTKIGLATVFDLFGASNSFNDGLELAGTTMEKMRKDAAALPGEFSDLKEFFSMGASPGLQAGASVDKLESMAAGAMAVSKALEVPMDQAAREYGMLLGGRAGAHNILGAKLGLTGDKAEAFNKMSGGDRIKELEKTLNSPAVKSAIQAYGTSFDGLWSSAIDNGKHFIALMTGPLFEGVKGTLTKVNQWFDDNQAKTAGWATNIGGKLADMWDWGIKKIQEWYPAIEKFANDAYNALSKIWDKFGPTISEAANALREALGNGQALSKIESILKMYAASKVATSGVGSSLMQGAGALAEAGPAGWAVMAGLAVDAALAAGALHALADSTSQYHERAVTAVSKLSTSWDHLSDQLNVSVMPLLEKFGVEGLENVTLAVQGFTNALDYIQNPVESVANSLDMLASKMDWFGAVTLQTIAAQLHFFKVEDNGEDKESADSIRNSRDQTVKTGLISFGNTGDSNAAADKLAAAVKKGAGAGGPGSTRIQKVEIVVNSNQDAGRVAELVLGKIQGLARHPRSSQQANNYSAPK